MAIFHITQEGLKPVERTTFATQGIRERDDLQRFLREQIVVLSSETLVIAEEFGEWEDSRRRIDLLGLDKAGNLVVIELKRTEDGGHMELQAIRYAAMVSTLTFERVVGIYQDFLRKHGKNDDAREKILDFLGQDEPDEDTFAQDVRIVLASAEFSKEVTSSVMWLNAHGLDIRCVRMSPYKDGDKTLLDIQTVIPLPEAEEYQIHVREKQQREREARNSTRDLTRFDLTVSGNLYKNLPKRGVMFFLIREIVKTGVKPEDLAKIISWRQSNLFIEFPGNLNEDVFIAELMRTDVGGKLPKHKRFFCKGEELFQIGDKTYALSNQWGDRTLEAVNLLANTYTDCGISITPTDA